MVKSAVTDIVSPTVTTDDPYGLTNKVSFHFKQWLDCFNRRSLQTSNKLILYSSLCVSVITCSNVCFERCLQFRFNSIHVFFHDAVDTSSLSCLCNSHTEAVFCVIFEQRVSPCNTFTLIICSKWVGWSSGAVDHGAACSVSYEHVTTKQLGNKSVVWSFTTSWAASGYFEVRSFQRYTCNSIWITILWLFRCVLVQIVSHWLLLHLCSDWLSCEGSWVFLSAITNWTYCHTYTTAYAVFSSKLDSELQTFCLSLAIEW